VISASPADTRLGWEGSAGVSGSVARTHLDTEEKKTRWRAAGRTRQPDTA